MAELKSCPFCGGYPHIDEFKPTEMFPYWDFVLKHTCKGGTGNRKRLSMSAGGFATREEAVAAWNRRVGETK